MSEQIKVYINSNEDGFITDCYFADNTKVSCEFYHEESEIEYSNCKLLNLQDYIKEKDQQIVYLQSQLDQANERLKGAILPKFKIGQKVWYISQNNDNVYEFMIKEMVFTRCKDGREMIVYYDEYCAQMYEYELYSSKEEAQAKLQELRGGE